MSTEVVRVPATMETDGGTFRAWSYRDMREAPATRALAGAGHGGVSVVRHRGEPPTTELRSPSVATAPVVWQAADQRLLPEWDAETAIRWAYLANTFVYACVRARAADLASLPFRIGADPDKPADFDPKHPLARLLGPPPFGPNPVTSARRLWANALANRIVTGRFAWELELDGGADSTPVGFWPLVVSALDPFPSKSGAAYWARFEYGRAADKKRLRPDQVFYSWNPSMSDWRQPESALQAARLDISVAVMQDRYDFAFLRNDARPAAVIVHEAFAEADEKEAFRAQFMSEHRGPDNAGRPMFVEAAPDGAEVSKAIAIQVLGLNQSDAKFIERYDAKVRAICVGLGVPMSRLMDASKRTFSNADRETLNYWQHTVVGDAVDLADDVNIQLAPRFGDKVGWFDTSGIPALQPPTRFTPITVGDAYTRRIATLNESRREVGLPEVDGGDEFVTLESVPSAVPAVPAPARESGQRELRQANMAGVMVALYPSPAAADSMAVEGGEAPEQLHLTLAYLGYAAELGVEREVLVNAVATFAAASPPLTAVVAGTGVFEGIDAKAVVALIDAPAMPEWRQRLVAALEGAGVELDHSHGFTPHITVAYVGLDVATDGIEAPAGMALDFGAVSLAWGMDRMNFTLRGERAAPTPTQVVALEEARRREKDAKTALAAAEKRLAAAVRAARTAVDPPERTEVVDHELRRTRIWRSADAQMTTLESGWERSMRSLFDKQRSAVISRLESKRGRKDFDPAYGAEHRATGERREVPADPSFVFDQSFWSTETAAAAATLYEAVMAVGGARVSDAFGVAFDITAPFAQDFITARANQLSGQVTDTTYAAIKDALAEGVAEGEGIPALSERIRGVFDQASKLRAKTIARTEVVSAFNGSAHLVALQLPGGVVGGQEWIATRDSRVRDAHHHADGQVVQLGHPFIVGGESLAYPGDPSGSAANIVNCRCTVAFLTPEEVADRVRGRVEFRIAEMALVRISQHAMTPAEAVALFAKEAA